MPPKQANTSRSASVARRGRSSARGRGGGKRAQSHVRDLSDITEESASQLHVLQAQEPLDIKQKTAGSSKKRPFQEVGGSEDGSLLNVNHETRAQTAKRLKRSHEYIGEAARSERPGSPEKQLSDSHQDPSSDESQHPIPPPGEKLPGAHQTSALSHYTPSLELLTFAHLVNLDTDADTETIALNLINLTLMESNWHSGLSGMVQPAACFLIASLLTRRQNLVEDIAESARVFGMRYEELVEGYRLLWEWRENMEGAVGEYAGKLDELPQPELLLRVEQCEDSGLDDTGCLDGGPDLEGWDEFLE